MKIINPNDFDQLAILIPRFYNLSEFLTFELYDESTRVTESFNDNNFDVFNGLLEWEFDNDSFNSIDFSEDGVYQLKISDGEEVVYRGKILATSQVTQEYKETNGLYTYE